MPYTLGRNRLSAISGVSAQVVRHRLPSESANVSRNIDERVHAVSEQARFPPLGKGSSRPGGWRHCCTRPVRRSSDPVRLLPEQTHNHWVVHSKSGESGRLGNLGPALPERPALPCIRNLFELHCSRRLSRLRVPGKQRVLGDARYLGTYLDDTEVVYMPRPNLKNCRPGTVPAFSTRKDVLRIEQRLQAELEQGCNVWFGSPTQQCLVVP